MRCSNVGNFIRSHIIRSSSNSAFHFYTSSGGNAGLAAVMAANKLGYPCTVIVPLSCRPMMVDKLRSLGAADVVQIGATWREADAHLREVVLAKDSNGVYVPPFDAEEIFEASAMIVDEVEEQLGKMVGKEGKVAPDAMVCSVGGGGLFSGIARGVEQSNTARHVTRIIASETVGADSLYQAVQAKERIAIKGITSIATSLGAVQVCQTAFDYAMRPNVTALTVSDKQAVQACRRFAEDERMLVEPACGAALAVAYEGLLGRTEGFNQDTKVVLVVCGGSIVSLELLKEWEEMFL